MKSTLDIEKLSVGELVSQNYRTAEVFNKYSVDYCCGGKKIVKQVCEKAGERGSNLLNELLETVNQEVDRKHDYASWKAPFLIDYILEHHHSYVLKSIPFLTELAEKVARVHGEHHPELIEIRDLFKQLSDELFQHMQKEEQILFPYVKHLSENLKKGIPVSLPPFGSVSNPITSMEAEHDLAGSLIHRIADLSSQFTIPADACNSYRVFYARLKEFEEDLHLHVHLENNILFPRAIRMEFDLNG